MKSETFHYLVKTPEANMTWVGGPLKEAEPGFVWLTNPAGEPVMKVKLAFVKTISHQEKLSNN